MSLHSAWHFVAQASRPVVPWPGSMGYVGDWLSGGKQRLVARCGSKGWQQEGRCGLESPVAGASNRSVRFDQLGLVVAG